jgi:hypothetical protein
MILNPPWPPFTKGGNVWVPERISDIERRLKLAANGLYARTRLGFGFKKVLD